MSAETECADPVAAAYTKFYNAHQRRDPETLPLDCLPEWFFEALKTVYLQGGLDRHVAETVGLKDALESRHE
jgi:hypothetical protein